MEVTSGLSCRCFPGEYGGKGRSEKETLVREQGALEAQRLNARLLSEDLVGLNLPSGSAKNW